MLEAPAKVDPDRPRSRARPTHAAGQRRCTRHTASRPRQRPRPEEHAPGAAAARRRSRVQVRRQPRRPTAAGTPAAPSVTEKLPRVAAVHRDREGDEPMPSFTRLSLSRIVRSRDGAAGLPITVVALTGSVGAQHRTEDERRRPHRARRRRAHATPPTTTELAARQSEGEYENLAPVRPRLERSRLEGGRVEQRRGESRRRRRRAAVGSARYRDRTGSEAGEHEIDRRRNARRAGGAHPPSVCRSSRTASVTRR